MSVEACVDRLKRIHYSLHRSWSICLARLTSEPIYELKMGFSHHAHLAAEHVTLFRERVSEMRHPPLGLDKVPDVNLEAFFDEILMSDSAFELVTGLYRGAFPAILESAKRYLEDTNLLTDAPTVRILKIMIPELESMIEWGNAAVSALEKDATDEERGTLETWMDELSGWLAASGQLDGTDPVSDEITSTPRFSGKDWECDNIPQRDERFPDPYNMGVHAEEFLYDKKFDERDKVLMMFYKRIREIDVPEMMAPIMVELMNATCDEEKGGRPWAF